MWKKIEPLVAGFWMGMLLAHNPWWISTIFIVLISVVALASYLNRHVRSFSQLREEWPVRYRCVRRIKAYLERRANLKFQTEEEAEKKLLDVEEADANYRGIVLKALEKLKAGSKPGWAVQAGVMALNRGDNETLQKLVNAAHDDIGLVTVLQERTGKKLGYLLGEF